MHPLLLVGAAALGVALVAGGPTGGSGAANDAPIAEAGLGDLVAVMDAAQLPEDWQIFLAAVAWGESRWNSDVGLGPNDHPGRPPWLRRSKASAGLQRAEAKAALRAYRHNANRFAGSPWPEDRYTWGSGGYFGMLPAYAVINGFAATPQWIPQIDPWDVTDPIVSVVCAVGFARGLMRWRQFKQGGGTWLALRVGWGRPGSMASKGRQNQVRPKLARALAELGVPESFMYRKVPQLTIPKGAALLSLIEAREAAAVVVLEQLELEEAA